MGEKNCGPESDADDVSSEILKRVYNAVPEVLGCHVSEADRLTRKLGNGKDEFTITLKKKRLLYDAQLELADNVWSWRLLPIVGRAGLAQKIAKMASVEPAVLLGIPGFKEDKDGKVTIGGYAGTVHFCCDLDGNVEGWRIKPFDAGEKKHGREVPSWWAPPGDSQYAHVSRGSDLSSDVVYIMEGPQAADIASTPSYELAPAIFIGITGVIAWPAAIERVKELLERNPGTKYTANVAIDMDRKTKPGPAAAVVELVEALGKLDRVDVQLLEWPEEVGYHESGGRAKIPVNGFDDLLTVNQSPAIEFFEEGKPVKVGNSFRTIEGGDQLEAALKPIRQVAARKEESTGDETTVVAAVSASNLCKIYPHETVPIIDGILRRGEVGNIIAVSKAGKSWLALGLAVSIANGRRWLGCDVRKGRVLIVDNELKQPTIANRMKLVCEAMGVPLEEVGDAIEFIPLRGKSLDIKQLSNSMSKAKLQANELGGFELVIVDALYRTLPEGTSEIDNAQMTQIYNTLDEYAELMNAAFLCVHHASKGKQISKSVIDVGSGAGAIARCVDAHIVIRDHEQQGLSILESKVRSFPPMPAKTIRWEFPCWSLSDVAPHSSEEEKKAAADLKKRDIEAQREARKEERKRETRGRIRRVIVRTLADRGKQKKETLTAIVTGNKATILETISEMEFRGEVQVEGRPAMVFLVPPEGSPRDEPPHATI